MEVKDRYKWKQRLAVANKLYKCNREWKKEVIEKIFHCNWQEFYRIHLWVKAIIDAEETMIHILFLSENSEKPSHNESTTDKRSVQITANDNIYKCLSP